MEWVRRKWTSYTSGLSRNERVSFCFLLLLVVAGNVLNVALTVERYAHAKSNPTSSLSVRHFTAENSPPYLLFVPQSVNISNAKNCDVLPASAFWNGGSNYYGNCNYLLNSSVVSIPTGSSAGNQPSFTIDVPIEPSFGPIAQCFIIVAVDPNVALQDTSDPDEFCSTIYQSTDVASQVAYCVNSTANSLLPLSVSAVQDPHGHVAYRFAYAQTQLSNAMLPPTPKTTRFDIVPALLQGMDNSIRVLWETQTYPYTEIDVLYSLATIFNISLTALAFFFPVVVAAPSRLSSRLSNQWMCPTKQPTVEASDTNSNVVNSSLNYVPMD